MSPLISSIIIQGITIPPVPSTGSTSTQAINNAIVIALSTLNIESPIASSIKVTEKIIE